MLALSIMEAAFVPTTGMKASMRPNSVISMQYGKHINAKPRLDHAPPRKSADYCLSLSHPPPLLLLHPSRAADYTTSRQQTTPATVSLEPPTALFRAGYEDYMEKRMANKPPGVHIMTPAEAKSLYQEYLMYAERTFEEYVASRSAAEPRAVSTAPPAVFIEPETIATVKSKFELVKSQYEDYLASRLIGPASAFVEPEAAFVEPEAAVVDSPAVKSHYEEYVASQYDQYMASRSASQSAAPIEPQENRMSGLGF